MTASSDRAQVMKDLIGIVTDTNRQIDETRREIMERIDAYEAAQDKALNKISAKIDTLEREQLVPLSKAVERHALYWRIVILITSTGIVAAIGIGIERALAVAMR